MYILKFTHKHVVLCISFVIWLYDQSVTSLVVVEKLFVCNNFFHKKRHRHSDRQIAHEKKDMDGENEGLSTVKNMMMMMLTTTQGDDDHVALCASA